MPFARKLALRYMHTTEPAADLVQVACIGLLNAIDRFEPGRGKKFTAYAAPTIVGELKRHFRDKGWSMHVPRDLQERALAVSQQGERLSSELGRTPTIDELSRALECTAEQTVEAMGAAHNYHPVSLDTPSTQTRRKAAARRHARQRGGWIRTRRRTSSARRQLANAQRDGAPGAPAASRARAHATRDQPTDRLLADARLACAAQIASPSGGSRGGSGGDVIGVLNGPAGPGLPIVVNKTCRSSGLALPRGVPAVATSKSDTRRSSAGTGRGPSRHSGGLHLCLVRLRYASRPGGGDDAHAGRHGRRAGGAEPTPGAR